MRNKFLDEETQIFLSKFDIIFLNETHFNERIKCPVGFIYEGRSEKVESTIPRGGVAVYRNKNSPLHIDIICKSLRDCLIVEVRNSDIVIASQYIPPSNSTYYNDIYFDNLKLIYEKFNKKKLLLLGDLNARIGNVLYKSQSVRHKPNPDQIINSNGRNLLKWIEPRQDMVILNGLLTQCSQFDSNWTFYRGNSMSQNDLAFSNDLKSISSFEIHPKMTQSDHCPVSLTYNIKLDTSLDFVHECAYHTFNDKQYDVNRRLKQPFRLDQIDITKAIQKLSIPFDLGEESNNVAAIRLTNHIYDCFTGCKKEKNFWEPAELHVIKFQSHC